MLTQLEQTRIDNEATALDERLEQICDEAEIDANAGTLNWDRIALDSTYRGAFISRLLELAQPEIGRQKARGQMSFGYCDGYDGFI